jgi:hypothetical protein
LGLCVAETLILLGCDVVLLGGQFLTFPRAVLPLFSNVNQPMKPFFMIKESKIILVSIKHNNIL